MRTVEHELPHSDEAPSQARGLAREVLGPMLAPDRLDDLVLLVSELVANAVQHAPPVYDETIGMDLETNGAVVRVVVRDGGTHLDPKEIDLSPRDDEHFGLYLVDERADRWGFSIDGVKACWFEMDRI
jgi:anti-sigma regulatory factor (Ser/Thr protein kinase)